MNTNIELAAQISAWKPESGTNIWEESGLYEGDIMVYQTSQVPKNGLLDPDSRWPNATVPFYIDDEFSKFLGIFQINKFFKPIYLSTR